jgi:DNA polymerase-3 subunit epsilon
MNDYIVLDLETPNRYCNSMSSIGIVIVEDGYVVEEKYSLINPEAPFDDFNIAFTGIHPEDVKDAPTFPEYWDEIKDLLLDNIIIGQNITFDLSVISKALTRYGMAIPPFKYYCTLNSCKRNLSLPDNSLSYIVHNVLKADYDAHNAMDDARMTNELFIYLEDYENDREDYIRTYCYRPNCKRDFDRTLDCNLNYLYGLLQKLNFRQEISENHYNLLKNWYNDNKHNNNHPLLQNLLLRLLYILKINNSKTENTYYILESFKQIKRSPQYKASVLQLQVFHGIIDSITCEEKISHEDKKFLNEWIEDNNINNKKYKKFRKEIDFQDKNLRSNLEEYSNYLTRIYNY